MTTLDLRTLLQTALGLDGVLTPEQMAALDPVIAPANTQGLCAVAPKSVAEIAKVFDICRQTKTPLIPQGGRTGLAGACWANGTEILLLGHKMPRILQIDPQSQTVIVSANTPLAELEQAVRQHGLTVGIDIAARDSATIGGMISTNAGGMEAFRNGTMRQRVLGLQAVLPDGTVLNDLAHVRKCNEGYDIKQLLIGAEGTLGVITAATLQLLQAPPVGTTFLLALPDAAAALRVLRTLQNTAKTTVLRAEAMWNPYASENAKHQPNNSLQNLTDAPLYVIYEVNTLDDPFSTVFELIEPLLEDGTVRDVIAAQNGQQANDIWRLRENTQNLHRVFPHALWFDISIPLAHLDAMLKTIETRVLGISPELKIFALGHLGDGNVHYSIANRSPIDDALAVKIKSALFDGLKDLGGSFSAEHGIGTEKRGALQKYGDPGKLAVMRTIKQTLDPHNICNPGKVV